MERTGSAGRRVTIADAEPTGSPASGHRKVRTLGTLHSLMEH